MNQSLLTDMYYAAPELWYALAALFGALLFLLISISLKLLKLKQKNYFLNRDRERYAETLYASKDGYFAFLYPDQTINDPRKNIVEHCSRRLAVIMNLSQGTNSKFEDILKNFYKDDAKILQKYVDMLKDDGVSFEDDFVLKNSNRRLHLSGHKISTPLTVTFIFRSGWRWKSGCTKSIRWSTAMKNCLKSGDLM